MKINVDFDWKFHKGIANQFKFELDMEEAIFTSYDDKKWDNINIPHDWNALDEFDGTLRIFPQRKKGKAAGYEYSS